MRRHVLWGLSATPVIAQPFPLRGLWALNDDHELTVKSGQPSEISIIGPRWCGYGLELTFSDRHSWPPRNHRDLELATERQPYLVPNDAAMTSSWLSAIVMLGPHKVTVTSSWPQKGSYTWSWVTRQWPRIGHQRSPCLVLTKLPWPGIDREKEAMLGSG